MKCAVGSQDQGQAGARPARGVSRALGAAGLLLLASAQGASVYLTDVPDYEWYYGCFGTATGNLMAYWDRHGLDHFYVGPTGGGLAPLDSYSGRGHAGIVSLWATCAGQDGRPLNQPGHVDDYYLDYESTAPDPYVLFGRTEHSPDCIGDFIGLNQKKWTNLNGECDGNIDGYSFVYWDPSGKRRVNFAPGPEAGLPALDIQSGLRAWTQWRGYTADVFTQLADFNPLAPQGQGFTFADLKAEIDAGYPVLLFLQNYGVNSRSLAGMARANPRIHGMLAYGYFIDPDGISYVRLRTSWGSGDNVFNQWTSDDWLPESTLLLPVRGVIGYHPRPQIMQITRNDDHLTLRWHGPASVLYDEEAGTLTPLHEYVVEAADSLNPAGFAPVAPPTTERQLTIPAGTGSALFLRVKLTPPAGVPGNR